MFQLDAILWLSILSFFAVLIISIIVHAVIDERKINKSVAWVITTILTIIALTFTLAPLKSDTVNYTLADHETHYINLTPQIANQPGQFRYDVTADGDPVETYLVTRTVQVVDSRKIPIQKEAVLSDKGVIIDGTTYSYNDERIGIEWSITQDIITKTSLIGHELWVEKPEKPSSLIISIVLKEETGDQWYKKSDGEE